jgi:nitronate monooxygenase
MCQAQGTEAVAADAYKQAIVDGISDDIRHFFTGVSGNYLRPSIVAAGLDPENLPASDPSRMSFGSGEGARKVWKDIWGAGQGIGGVKQVQPASRFIARLAEVHRTVGARLAAPA